MDEYEYEYEDGGDKGRHAVVITRGGKANWGGRTTAAEAVMLKFADERGTTRTDDAWGGRISKTPTGGTVPPLG